MTAPSGGEGSSFGSGDWAKIFQGVQSGAEGGMNSAKQNQMSKRDVKEAKRRMMANLLNNALKRDRDMFEMSQDYGDTQTNFKNDALRQMARGFVGALQGSTGR